MSELDVQVIDWLDPGADPSAERATLSSLRITAGANQVPVTEVEDTIARTVRGHINVSAYPLARWLSTNWWRLRWEPGQRQPKRDWLQAHSLASIGADYAWPPLQLASDGEFVQVQLTAENAPDVSAIRYLRGITVDVPAAHFERAVDGFLDQVEGRLTTLLPEEHELSEIRAELQRERSDPDLARSCKLQALAGMDPGSAGPEWLQASARLVAEAGAGAGDEIVAALPSLKDGFQTAQDAISAMRDSPINVRLDWATLKLSKPSTDERPWKKGARLAAELRRQLRIPPGPLTNDRLAQLLEVKLPLVRSRWSGERGLEGGFRTGANGDRVALLVTTPRRDNQRFYLARLIGGFVLSRSSERILPVTNTMTAMQKFERSFARELLCPWNDLNEYIESHGIDDEGIADAAEHFDVSDWVIRYVLINKQRLGREDIQVA